MLTFIVRSKRDADAIKAMISRFYSEWMVSVKTLHGARGTDKIVDAVLDVISENPGFYIVLLGREDSEAVKALEKVLPPNAVAHLVPRAKIRNARLEMLYIESLKARAKLRLGVTWDSSANVYRLGWKYEKLEDYQPDISYDLILGIGSYNKLVSSIVGGQVGRNPVVLRAGGGLHLVYNGQRVRARYWVHDDGVKPVGEVYNDVDPVDLDLNKFIGYNREGLNAFEKASISFLRKIGENYDTIIVPWSGGKDSTASLLLALKAFGRGRIRVIYGDTGTEFPHSVEYVEFIARKLGIDYVVAYAGVDKALREGAPMPTHDNRWCTGLKIAAIENTIAELAEGETLVVVGDRDAESARRSNRPPLREGLSSRIKIIAPLKPWSGLHVIAYIMSNGLPLNPLYEYGFYRIGCYMCPALRDWELNIMMKTPQVYYKLLRSPIFRKFMHLRMYSRSGEDTKTTRRLSCTAEDLCGCGF